LYDFRIPIESFTYSKTEIRDQWLNLLEQIYFLGVSVSKYVQRFWMNIIDLFFQGPVSFRNRQRRAETLISQFQVYSKQQRIQTIAEYSHMLGLNTKCSRCRALTWPGMNNIISIEKKSFI